MIIHKCDVCDQVITERFIVVIDNKEHDICKACKAKTVGKVKNGRPLNVLDEYKKEYVPIPMPYYPWYEPYKQPTWVGPNTMGIGTGDKMPETAKIWCSFESESVMPSLKINTGSEYLQNNGHVSFTIV